MNTLMNRYLDRIKKLNNGECWYIVKQDTSFWKQCYYTQVLLQYITENSQENLENYIKEKIAKMNKENPELKLSDTYRSLRISYFYGLITSLNGDFSSYKNATGTEIYEEIKKKTEGKFEKIELYRDIIREQIEKLYISSKLDENSDSIRKDFRIFPAIFLYKILLEIGISTGEYKISYDEYLYFVSTQPKYNNYLDALLMIKLSREEKFNFESLKDEKSKFDNRLKKALEQLDTLTITNNSIELNMEYLEHVENVVKNIKNYEKLQEENYYKFLSTKLKNIEENGKKETLKSNLSIPYQRIYFGAPGTGKSYLLNKEVGELGYKYERVTFHPNYMYGNFIGTFKPFPKKIGDKEEITYKYVPGVLLRLLIDAFKNPEENYMLVIEEINRANTAGVFGDFFQLLDRNKDGESQYPISTSEELREYLKEKFEEENLIKDKLGNNFEKIYLPKNLYIWATMNSSDQGSMPLDTAFKRRWNFKYIGIDEGEEGVKEKYSFKVANKKYLWNDFRKKLNEELLKNCNVPEDKLLGPYFIDKGTLDSSTEEELTEIIKNKVLMYLYEDIGKMYRNILFSHEVKTYSELCSMFSEDINKAFKNIDIPSIQTEDSVEENKLITENTVGN
jgi:putative restrictase